MNDISQSELMGELGVKPVDRRKIRNKILSPDDWWKDGRKIMIRHAGEVKLRVWKECPELIAEIKTYYVCQIPLNPRYVLINVGGKSESCVIPPRLKPSFEKGKPIRVQAVTDAKGTTYRHVSIS